MRSTLLHQDWTFQQANDDPGYPRPQLKAREWLPALVPGSVHLDLMANGVIADPHLRRYETGAHWIDEADWTYRTTFQWTSDVSLPKRTLMFHGLDSVVEIWLNGAKIAESDNFFLPVEVDVSDCLLEGANQLECRFISPVREGMRRRLAFFEGLGLPQTYGMFDERAFVRKPGYMSGWDWGPRILGCGIWQPVELIEFSNRITNLEVSAAPEADGRFRVKAHAETEAPAKVNFSIFGDVQAEVAVLEDQRVEWLVRGDLWWPRGMGKQPLHTVNAGLDGGNSVEKRIGFRTMRLLRQPDVIGESFEFEVNGRRIWARGANWIPNDSFPARITDQDLKDQVKAFADLNMNMLRVWGGGLYERESFYDACDEEGVLVWQDFPFGCMYYPDDEEWQAKVKVEASHHVSRLRHRASLALWCGNNENHVMHQTRWAGEASPDRYFGENLYEGTLPDVVRTLDPATGYIATSPIGMSPDATIPVGPARNDGMDRYGDAHYWDVWHGRGDWPHYRDSHARFSSEFGFASSCSLPLWQECLGTMDFPSAEMLHHDKTGKPWSRFLEYVTLHYAEPRTMEDWVYSSQLNQRDALRCGIEHFRRSDFCRGSLIWQANDCWPVQSWAVQDYARRLKPAGFELKRLYADLMISIDHLVGFDEAGIWLVNDGLESRAVELAITITSTLTGAASHNFRVPLRSEPGSRVLVHNLPLKGHRPNSTAIKVEILGDPMSARWFMLDEPKNMRFGPVRLRLHGDELHVDGFVADMVQVDSDTAGLNVPSAAPITVGPAVIKAPPFVQIGSRFRSLAGHHVVE